MLGNWGRVAGPPVALAALVLCLLAAAPAEAAFDCGGVMRVCQTQVDNSGRVWFISEELLTEDALGSGERHGGVLQYYERDGDTTTLIHGPDGKPIPYGERHRVSEEVSGVSPDGERVYIETEASLTPGDHDTPFAGDWTLDGYELRDGQFTLVTTGPLDESRPDVFGCCGARIVWASDDGSRVYFVTGDRMTAEDQDESPDVYERAEGQTRLVSTGPGEVLPDPNYSEPAPGAEFLGASPDGRTAYFATFAQLTADDTEKMTSDIYSWRDGVTTRLTHTRHYPAGPGQPFDYFMPIDFAGASDDGSIFFTAHSPQIAEDTDANGDIYRGHADGSAERLVTGGPPPSSEKPFPNPLLADAVSQDGTRLYFTTTSSLVPADNDSKEDIYLLLTESGRLQLVSQGAAAEPNEDSELTFSGISRDGKRAYFSTWEQLLPEDADEVVDVYEWFDGHVRLATPSIEGHQNGSFFDSISPNGRYVVFSTWEDLDPNDEDAKSDIYLADMGSEASVSAVGSASGSEARRGARRRWNRRIRQVNVEAIPPHMRIGGRGNYGDGAARVRLGCPKAETSGPCHGRARLFSRRGRRLAAGRFRIAAGHRAWVALRGTRLPRRGHLDAVVRVRAADMLHNAARARAKVELRHTP
jgi:hypothetical protein